MYNAAIRAYRVANGISSANHPAPEPSTTKSAAPESTATSKSATAPEASSASSESRLRLIRHKRERRCDDCDATENG